MKGSGHDWTVAHLLQLLHERGVAHPPPAHDDLCNTDEETCHGGLHCRRCNACMRMAAWRWMKQGAAAVEFSESGSDLCDSEARVLQVKGDAMGG